MRRGPLERGWNGVDDVAEPEGTLNPTDEINLMRGAVRHGRHAGHSTGHDETASSPSAGKTGGGSFE